MLIDKFLSENRKQCFILLLITLLAYWPLTLNIFGLKNDALVYFLPYRYHVSEAIQHGHFPWWNPYLYSGLPLHSDIQSGVWNPVVMLISCFTTYNMSVLQWELLFYLFIASIGMYKLVKELGSSSNTSFLSAIAYMCCGFMTDSGSFIPWITSASYLPFVFLFFYRLLNKPAFLESIKLSLALTLLFTSGYPSFFIFCCYILLIGFIFFCIQNRKKKIPIYLITKYCSLAIVIFLLICSPVILSWLDFFEYYDRGKSTSLEKVLLNSFPPFSSISYLFPSAVYKEHPWLPTDVSVRNASVGIFFFTFFLRALLKKKSPTLKFVLAISIFSFLFSLGSATPLREWCYDFVPLMNTFRHPSCMRLFTSIGILLVAAPFLDNIFFNFLNIKKRLIQFLAISAVILISFIIYYSIQSDFVRNPSISLTKEWMDNLTLSDLVVIQGSLQLLFVLAFLIVVWKNKSRLISTLITINCVLFCWLALPLTFISQVRTPTMNQHIASFPEGFPVPDNDAPINAAVQTHISSTSPLGYDNFYNKKIGIQDYVITPTINTKYNEFLRNIQFRKILNSYPFAYLSDSSVFSISSLPESGKIVLLDSTGRPQKMFQHTIGTVIIKEFSNNRIEFETSTESYGLLNLFQQYHHSWHAWVGKDEVPVYRSNIAFMSIPITPGKNTVILKFQPIYLIKLAIYISLSIVLLILLIFIFRYAKNRNYYEKN